MSSSERLRRCSATFVTGPNINAFKELARLAPRANKPAWGPAADLRVRRTKGIERRRNGSELDMPGL